MRKPNFFILGAPKCGTTSLAEWLSQHPSVYVAPDKEPHYFRTDLDPTAVRDLKRYEALFRPASKKHIAVGEASTGYLYSNTAVPNILQYSPFARFIVMVRNPLEMAPSLHQQRIREQNEPIEDFATAWDMQPKRRRGEGAAKWCPDPRLLLYGEICRLGEQLERLYRHVSTERVLVLFLEDVQADPRRSYLRVLDFLGVPDDGRVEFPIVNRAHAPRSQRLRGFVKYLAVLRRRFRIPRFRTGVVAVIHALNLRRVQVAPLPQATRRQLIDYFSDDIARLSRLTGRNLHHWLS